MRQSLSQKAWQMKSRQIQFLPNEPQHRRVGVERCGFERPLLDLDPALLLSVLIVCVLLAVFVWGTTPMPSPDAASTPTPHGVER